jgi:hypothetical protein
VSWRRGNLVIEDHDLVAERALRALGAETPACLQLLKQWRELHSWATSTELFVQMRDRLGPERILAPGALAATNELALLLTWERAWRASSYLGGGHQQMLQEQLRARAREPLRRHVAWWAGQLGADHQPSVEVDLLRRGQPPRVTGGIDRFAVRANVALGVAWVLEVWARGLAVVDGALVLELAPSPTALRARAVRWEAAPDGMGRPVAAPALLARGPDGAWRLAWEAPA